MPRALSRLVVACLALVAWVGVQAAALAHVGCTACAADEAGTCEADPDHGCCGHDHGCAAHGHAHDDARPGATEHEHDAPPAPGDHDADSCALCAFAASVVDAPSIVVVLAPATAGMPRAAAPFLAPASAPRFEPGLARGPPTLPRS